MPVPTSPTSPPSAHPAIEPAWTDPLLQNPHAVADKAARVHRMFSAIAPSYDLNNRLHSMGIDQHWRNVAVSMAEVQPNDTIVDVACGTGDLTIKFTEELFRLRGEKCKRGLGRPSYMMSGDAPMPPVVMGIDFTYEMLPIAREKSPYVHTFGTDPQLGLWDGRHELIQWINADALALPLPDRSADIVSIAFGIRNVADWGKAIDEFARVLRPGGRLIILEFSLPTNALLRAFYNFYFRRIMPITATLISRDKTGAYKYLPESVNTFISRDVMQSRMQQSGFHNIVARPLTGGICVCYKGVRT